MVKHFPKIGDTTLQGRLSGRVVGFGHASGGKGRGRVLPPNTEGEQNWINVLHYILIRLSPIKLGQFMTNPIL